MTTDTSIAHVSLNLDVPTYVLLTSGCEWRWADGVQTNWYPNANLIKQEEQGNWKSVIDKLIGVIN